MKGLRVLTAAKTRQKTASLRIGKKGTTGTLNQFGAPAIRFPIFMTGASGTAEASNEAGPPRFLELFNEVLKTPHPEHQARFTFTIHLNTDFHGFNGLKGFRF